jgi:Ca2+-binding EF-hand superfamily protein
MGNEQQELVDKVRALMVKNYGSDDEASLRKLFDAYDSDHDGKIGKKELEALLKDAGIGNGLTRGAWVKGVIGALDENDDNLIDWAELSKALSR